MICGAVAWKLRQKTQLIKRLIKKNVEEFVERKWNAVAVETHKARDKPRRDL